MPNAKLPGGSMGACMEQMMSKGRSQESAAKICQSIRQRVGGA